MNFRHEYDSEGRHRIIWIPTIGARRFGEWTGYQGIASLNHAGKSAVAVTPYHGDVPFAADKIYFVEEQ